MHTLFYKYSQENFIKVSSHRTITTGSQSITTNYNWAFPDFNHGENIYMYIYTRIVFSDFLHFIFILVQCYIYYMIKCSQSEQFIIVNLNFNHLKVF